jgi:hypothetical protein
VHAVGYLPLKIAAVAYNPIMENRPGAPRLHAATGWADPLVMARAHTNWWDRASFGMVRCELVVQTNLDIWPIKEDGFRYTDTSYWAIYTNGWQGAHSPDTIDYSAIFLTDMPWLLTMIETGAVDQVWVFGFPYMGCYETRLFGPGAYECNSPGTEELGNKRLFMASFPSMERPDTPMENFGHGCEGILGAWFWNYLLNYPGWADAPYTNINDFALFTRAVSNSPANIHCGNVHFAPNSYGDYEWGSTRMVSSYADAWYSYPLMTNAPRLMNCSEWGNGVNAEHKIWWFKHMPQKVGLRRGHLMNWLTMLLNLQRAAYPLGSDQTLSEPEADLAGWFAFEVYAPPGTTEVRIDVTTGRSVEFGVQKDSVPLTNRFNWWGPRNGTYDYWSTGRSNMHTLTINDANNYGHGVTGYWYFTFGRAFTSPTSRPANSATNFTVRVSISPQPTNSAPVAVTVTAPAFGTRVNRLTTNIVWTVGDLPQGVRASYLMYSTNSPSGPWQPICEDYHYQLGAPYRWSVPAVTSGMAYLRVVVEDVYGVAYEGVSSPFGLNTDFVPEPGVMALGMLLLGARRRAVL